jgi:hypothetical protein
MNRLVDRVLGAGAPEDALYMTTIDPRSKSRSVTVTLYI